nr:hypothetical protein [Tanacetum cinerariifolium]
MCLRRGVNTQLKADPIILQKNNTPIYTAPVQTTASRIYLDEDNSPSRSVLKTIHKVVHLALYFAQVSKRFTDDMIIKLSSQSFVAAISVRALLHELTTEIAASMNNVNRRNKRSGGNGNGRDVPATIHVLLERAKYEREYKSICQLDGETTIEFMTSFVRLAGFLGAEAGTPEEQAKNFKWALNDIAHDKLVNMEFTDMVKVANTTRNIEIFQKEILASTQNDNKKRTREDEQDENEARLGKQRDNHRNQWRQNTQQSNGRIQNRDPRRSNASYSKFALITDFGHRAEDCKNKDRKGNGGDDKDEIPKNIRRRVFALTASQYEKA